MFLVVLYVFIPKLSVKNINLHRPRSMSSLKKIHLNNAESKNVDRDCNRVLGVSVIGCKHKCSWV